MLLRRLLQHFRNENWFAVFLDFIVVVLGIFIGMQVTDWNNARKDRKQEQVYLERLYEDFSSNTTFLKKYVDMHDRYRKHIMDVAYFLAVGKPDEGRAKDLASERLGATVLPDIKLRLGTYNELVSTGQLNILRSSELKTALEAFSSKTDYATGQLNYMRMINSSVHDMPEQMSVFQPRDDGTLQIDYGFNAFVGNQEMVRALVSSSFRQGLMYYVRKDQLDSSQVVSQLLACLLNKPECSSDGTPTAK